MREGTLALFYFCKYLELGALLIWTVLMIGQISLILQNSPDTSNTTELQMTILLPIVAVLSLYNLLFNNLLINLRFYCKMKCVTVGMCIFDCINIVQCHCCLDKPCRDRCFTPWTIVKWVLKSAIIGYTVFILGKLKGSLEEEEEQLGKRGEEQFIDEYSTM